MIKNSKYYCSKHLNEGFKQQKLLYKLLRFKRLSSEKECDLCSEKADWMIYTEN